MYPLIGFLFHQVPSAAAVYKEKCDIFIQESNNCNDDKLLHRRAYYYLPAKKKKTGRVIYLAGDRVTKERPATESK